MDKKLKIIFVLTVVFFLLPIEMFAQEFELGIRQYKQEGGKWYIYNNGVKCDRIVPNRLIVRKKSKEKPKKSDFEKLNITGAQIKDKRYIGGFYVLNIDESKNPFEIAEKIYQSADYNYLEFDTYVSFCSEPGETNYESYQWNLKSDRLDMPRAWDITTGNCSIILAFIDSGFEIDHEDIDGNLWINSGETAGDEIDNDNNGFIDDIHGWHFGGKDWREGGAGDDSLSKDAGHGTMVLGIVTAQTNNYESGSYKGIAGIAGGWGTLKGVSAMLLATESSSYDDTDDSTYLTSVVDCITYAMNNGARVINMSFSLKYTDGYDYVRAVIDTAVDNYNCVCIAAAGNSGGNIEFPASYSKTIAVGMVDEDDDYYGGSHGNELDVVAPTMVYTTKTVSSGSYGVSEGGTSFSAPHVTGIAALILSINNGLTPSEVKEIIINSTDNEYSGWNEYTGWGRVNAYKALKKTIQEYGGSSKTLTFSNNVTIQSGDTLTIDPGSTVEFYPGKKLIVKGTLIADSITFTKYSTSNWGGIRFDNAGSGSVIENCSITYADTGIVLLNSDITIESNEISDTFHFGIFSYSSSPLIESNEIYDTGIYGIYAYGETPEITNNYVHDINQYGIALNASSSSTFLMYNSIIDCGGGVKLYGQNYANLRGKSGTNGAFNKIENYDDGPGTYGVMITGGSPELGNYYPTSEAGKNDFIYEGRDVVYESVTGEIYAEKNYWGGTPQSSWFTGSVSIDGWYSSSQGGGSSLELTKPAGITEDMQLLSDANELLDSKSFLSAALIYKQLVEEYPDSRFAGKALAKAMSAYRQVGTLESQRSYLQSKRVHQNKDVSNKGCFVA